MLLSETPNYLLDGIANILNESNGYWTPRTGYWQIVTLIERFCEDIIQEPTQTSNYADRLHVRSIAMHITLRFKGAVTARKRGYGVPCKRLLAH